MASYSVSLNLDNADPLFQQKKTILENNGIDVSKPFEISESAPLPTSLLSALRVQSLTSAELNGAIGVQGGRIEAVRADRQNAFGAENQKNALSSLRDALNNNGSSFITVNQANPDLIQKTNDEINKLL
ncbi:hypothetical protein H8356DRAFT_919332 [Neocallimastix lanati (nom. inval.)]|jgi:hypothetical protein|uniref:Rubisco LSMT substrate-binding domain-containing protein n=1 Tax=Neocallimastix californiae TaxID=1754190 RepID=A0A1Y2BNB0_9FUNG|nr:hypothetical protein H8356DRAFT_919332 [Neocallimastix sp. JGI-2020a]ORY36231.1 hypothetical protein LY90DRAFT_704864 [Neocallimastix californiae]|eukprot:ORY36231.1 hypothetical protein LY90DRAFT_704864 [Neocallimastix californiae]